MVTRIIERAQVFLEEHQYVRFTDEELAAIPHERVEEVIEALGNHVLMMLPEHEIRFFEWLKTADPPVWADLWQEDDDPCDPYLISLQFLPDFVDTNTKGVFHIRDLQTQINYFFAPQMFYEKESKQFVEAVKDRFVDHASLTTAQALTLEASVGPVDLWHFCFRNGVEIETAKRAVQGLVDDKILVHVPTANHLSTYFDVE